MNRVVHFEIHAADKPKVQKFYQEVFGWEMQPTGPEMGNYVVVKTGDPVPKDMASIGINGGITTRMGALPQGGEPVNAFVCIIGIQNIDDILKKVLAAGGTTALDKMDVPTVGLLAYCKDPEGTLFGVLQPSPTMSAQK